MSSEAGRELGAGCSRWSWERCCPQRGETSRQEWDRADLVSEDMEMGGGDKDDEIGLLAQEPLECQLRTRFPTAARLASRMRTSRQLLLCLRLST